MIPQLRFPEFTDEWRVKKLGDFSVTFSGGTPVSTNKTFYSGTIPFIKSGEISSNKTAQYITDEALKKSSAKLVDRGDILYALYGATSGQVAISQIKGAINQAILCIRPEANRYFIYSKLAGDKSKILSIYLQGGQGNLSSEIIKSLKIGLPSKPEQEKIAEFLTAVDERIAAGEKKLELLQKYKKGVMQKIFTQQIRFKDENGNPFPEWEEKRLGDIGKTYTGLTGKSGADFGNGTNYVTYMQIFSDSKIDVTKFSQVQILPNERQNKVEQGDIFFTTSSETPQEVGYTSVMLDPVDDVYLNSFCFGYRADKTLLATEFARYFFHNQSMRAAISRLAQGSTRFNLSKNELMKLSVKLPKLEEQHKIVTFLTALDDKIAAEHTRLTAAKQWKKGLLQRMFV